MHNEGQAKWIKPKYMSIEMPKQYEEQSIEDSNQVLKSLKTIFRSVYGNKISIEITDKVSSMAFCIK